MTDEQLFAFVRTKPDQWLRYWTRKADDGRPGNWLATVRAIANERGISYVEGR